MKKIPIDCRCRNGKTLELEKKIAKIIPRIELNYFDYFENRKEIREQIFCQFGNCIKLVLICNSQEAKAKWAVESLKTWKENIRFGFQLLKNVDTSKMWVKVNGKKIKGIKQLQKERKKLEKELGGKIICAL